MSYKIMDRQLNKIKKMIHEQNENVDTETIRKQNSGAENIIIKMKNSAEFHQQT